MHPVKVKISKKIMEKPLGNSNGSISNVIRIMLGRLKKHATFSAISIFSLSSLLIPRFFANIFLNKFKHFGSRVVLRKILFGSVQYAKLISKYAFKMLYHQNKTTNCKNAIKRFKAYYNNSFFANHPK